MITVPALEKAISAQLWERMHFSRFVRELRPDVLFYPSGTLGYFPAGIPVVAACHNLLYFDDKEYRKYRYSKVWWRNLRRLRRQHRVLFSKTAGIIFFSPYSQELAVRKVPGIKLCTVIPHGVEANFLADSPTPTIDRPPFNILYVSTVMMYKHQWNVVKAVKQLRDSSGVDYQLWLAGNADELGGRVLERALKQERAESFTHWMGGVSHDAIPSLLRKADIFVFASSCEAFPITLLEAMASGLPVACSNRTGLPDLLRDGGVYFDPETRMRLPVPSRGYVPTRSYGASPQNVPCVMRANSRGQVARRRHFHFCATLRPLRRISELHEPAALNSESHAEYLQSESAGC